MLRTKGSLLSVLSFFAGFQAFSAEITGVDLKMVEGTPRVEIRGSDLQAVQAFQKENPAEVILVFKGTMLGSQVSPSQDLSNSGTDILQINSYYLSDEKQSKIVIGFRKLPKYSVKSQSDLVYVEADTKTPVVAARIPESPDDALKQFTGGKDSKRFNGTPITLKLKDADVHEALRMISEASGFNIVVHPGVKGTLSLSLESVPWDQALDVILNTMALTAERNESVLRVMTVADMTKERSERLAAEKLVVATSPKTTRVFPISYADLGSLVSTLKDYAKAISGAEREDSVIADPNTNSVIVRDSADNVERMRKMIELLDVQTPQVLIEAKVVEASEDFAREFGGSFGINGGRGQLSFNGSTAFSSLIGTADFMKMVGSGAVSASPSLSLLRGSQRLTAALRLGEEQNKLKLVSSPKTVVMSGKTSTVNQSKTILLDQTTVNNGTTVVTKQQLSADIKLNVTPKVTNDGSVYMKLNLTRGVVNLFRDTYVVNPRTIDTEVIIDSGQTLVIGGVLTSDEETVESGLPWLRKIPLIGALFGSELNSTSRSELLFFITPKILNQKRIGIGKI